MKEDGEIITFFGGGFVFQTAEYVSNRAIGALGLFAEQNDSAKRHIFTDNFRVRRRRIA